MRYYEYFVKAAELAAMHPDKARELLREAKCHASQVIPEHLVRCARGWGEDLHDYDNSIRCLLEAECRACDRYMYLYLATAHLTYFGTVALAERFFRKAVALANSADDFARLREFFETFAPDMAARCRPAFLKLEQRISSTRAPQIEQGEKDGHNKTFLNVEKSSQTITLY